MMDARLSRGFRAKAQSRKVAKRSERGAFSANPRLEPTVIHHRYIIRFAS
jgi:hypothetical protein